MRHLLRALAGPSDPLPDAELLARYAESRDPAAFELLVWRHGGMVLGVCRRHLRDAHAADDAFQATFLVLARKAKTVRADTLPGFLHRVARRTAVRAAGKRATRREVPLTAEPSTPSPADPELAGLLDAEIDRLPARLRQVVVLCYLHGVSTAAAAGRLGVPRGTVLSRLAAARTTLQARLLRRGVTPPAVGLTAVLSAEQVAGCGGGMSSVAATLLANEVLAMTGRKLVWGVACGLVLAAGGGTGVGVLTAQSGGPPGGGKAEPPAAKPANERHVREAVERAEREAATRAAARRKRLEEAIRELDDKITRVRKDIERMQKESGASRDPAVIAALIQAEAQNLNHLQRDIYEEEKKVRELEVSLLRHKQNMAAVDTLPLHQADLEQAVRADPVVQERQAAKTAADKRLQQAQQNLQPQPIPSVVALAKSAAEAGDGLRAAVDALRPAAEKAARAARRKQVAALLAADHETLAMRKALLAGMVQLRAGIEQRIKDLHIAAETIRVLDDDLRPLLEQRDAIGRRLIQDAVDPQPGPAPAGDKLDAILHELRDIRRLLETRK